MRAHLPLLTLALALVAGILGASTDSSARAPADEASILRFLETAEIVDQEVITSGINRPLRLTLSDGTTTRDAVFRTVDRSTIARQRDGQLRRVRDHWQFEVAAYRLDQLLGLGRIPPTTLRTIDGREGSNQLWVDNASTGAELIIKSAERGAAGIAHRDAVLAEMALFDLLVHNYDRHLENVLYDADDHFWWIDHSRTFPPTTRLPEDPTAAQCRLPLLQRLDQLTTADLRREMRGLLTSRELNGLQQRRSAILRECRRGGVAESAPTTTF